MTPNHDDDRSAVDSEARALYREGFAVTCAEAVEAGATPVDGDGIAGYLPADDGRASLLVTDDAALERLRELLPRVRLAMVRVLPAARDCLALLDGDPSWPVREQATAMVRRDLGSLPVPPTPDGLTIVPVERPPYQTEGVSLRAAAVASIEADPLMPPDPDGVVKQLLALRPSTQLFAAVDADDVIRATSASGYTGNFVGVSFVTTDPGWRRRGAATAMTAHALRAANDRGATVASLEATDAGYPVYRRLGFDVVGEVHCFARIV